MFLFKNAGKLEIHETDNRKAAIEAAIAAGQAWFTGDKAKAMSKGMESLKGFLQGPAANDPDAQKRAIHIVNCYCMFLLRWTHMSF
jgi:hypothetical protein